MSTRVRALKNQAFLVLAVLLGCVLRAHADEQICRSVLTAPADKAVHPAKSTQEELEENIEISSKGAELGARSGEARLKDALIRQGSREISADDVQGNLQEGAFRVEGNVDYRDPQVHVRGESGTYDRVKGAHIGNAQFEVPSRPARGTAKDIKVSPDGKVALGKVEYTTCPPDDRDWVLKASNISLDTQAREGTGKGVRLDFKGVPILYTPIISFPLGNERKSGFLFPDFGHSNRKGAELSVPYYFNLAPNYDLTLTPHYFSRRGLGLDPEFRYLTEQQHGSLAVQYLPSDDLRGNDRSFVQWLHQTDFARDWRLTIDASNVSDENYFEDFGLGSENTSVTYLERDLELAHYGRHWTLLGQVQNFQTIDQTVPDGSRPYSRLPRLRGKGVWDRGPLGLDYSLNSELVYFYRDSVPDDLTGARMDVQPEVSWSFRRPGLYLTPAVAYRQTQYELSDVAPGASKSPHRGAPIGSFDAGMVFERVSGRHASRVQTLEPRLLYLYVPYRDQSQLPVFDSGLPDLNLVQLFRRNRYVGADRLSDANQVSFGVTSRLLDANTGQQFLSATFGQTYYFDSPRVTLPGEAPTDRGTSNFISQLALTAYKDWNINLGHEWNPQDTQSDKTEIAVQYRPGGTGGGNRVVNAGYRFRRDLIEQVDTSVAWPVAKRWNIYARGVYSLRDDALIEQFAGFEYASCCWRVRLVQRRYVSDRTGQRDSSIALQLELTGLSSVGVPADAFLERSIRGYSRN